MVDKAKLPKRIIWLRLLAFTLIIFERMAACFWRPLTWALFFSALWLFNIPALLGNFGQYLSFFAFGIGIILLIQRDVFAFRLPSLRTIDRRIEKDSCIEGRPLTGLKDKLWNDEKPDARDLWRESRFRLNNLANALSRPQSKDFLKRYDPYAFRFTIFIVFIAALFFAGEERTMRLQNGLQPFSYDANTEIRSAERYTIMIDAPEYTRLSQLILNDKTAENSLIKIAQGSALKVLVHGGYGQSKLILGNDDFAFDDAYQIVIPDEKDAIVLKQGLLTLARWNYEIIRDQVPTVLALESEPEILDDASLSIGVSVYDDYGVQYLDTTLELSDVVSDSPAIGDIKAIRRSVSSPARENFKLSPNFDFSAHPWAGLPVKISMRAVDALGQESTPQIIETILPERDFKHPVAKTLVALRKKLIWSPLDENTYKDSAYNLLVLGTAKELLHDDIVTYLALRTAALRLSYNSPSIETASSVISLLWDTALRIEDGDLSLAARKLRDAQMALEEALQNPDITEEEISELMSDLRNAMAEYMNELAREMSKRMADGGQMPMIDPQSMTSLNQDALADFLEQMEQAMRDGDMGAAQEMLSQMQRLMDMMNPSMSAQLPPDMQMMNKGVNELQKLIERQEELLVQTQKQADVLDMLNSLGLDSPMNIAPEADGEAFPPFINTEDNQTEQEALRFILGQLMVEASEMIGEIPEQMGLAEQSMRRSARALGVNRPDGSIPNQKRAIEYLKQSQDQMMQQLQQRMVQMTGFMLSFGRQQMRYDPLGRPMGREMGEDGDPFGSDVTIPDEAEHRRVEEILKLLRQRAGQYNRPREELDYYRRLLKRF